MAQLNFGVDQNNLEDNFDALPAGEYKAIIEESDYGKTRAGDGEILKLVYKIIDGHAKDKKHFEYLVLKHPNQDTVSIAQRKFNSICVALGITDVVKDTSQLHNIPLILTLGVKGKETDEYGIQNFVKKHLSMNSNATTTTSSPVQTNETGVAKNPWEKK